MKRLLKEKWQWHIAAIVLALFVLSLLSWMYFAISMGRTLISHFVKNNNATENTSVASTDFKKDEAINVSQEEGKLSDTWDHAINYVDLKWYSTIFEQSYLSKIDSIVTYYATGEISSSQVILGRDNWLFYKSKTDGDPIGDYEGTSRYSQDEMNNILQVSLSTQREVEDRGIKFAILVAPNKENIYSEFMPDIYTHREISRTDLLVDYLYDNGVNVISPKTELLNNHLDFQVYYSYDTHWNQLGAYIGVKNTLAAWDISLPELSDRTISAKNLKGNYHLGGRDDLARMVGLLAFFDDEIEYEVDGTLLMDWEIYETDQNNEQISHFINDLAKNKETLLLVGDSFRTSMIPVLREIFSDVYVVNRSYYTTDMLDDINPDYLIAEYVERYSGLLGDIDILVK